MAQFKVGDMVECIFDGIVLFRPPFVPPVLGAQYTVTGVRYDFTFNASIVHLKEIMNGIDRGDDIGYAAPRFRLIQPPSIEWAHEIVRKVGKRGKVSA